MLSLVALRCGNICLRTACLPCWTHASLCAVEVHLQSEILIWDMQPRIEVCQGQTLTHIQRQQITGHTLCRHNAVCHFVWSRPRKKLTAAWRCRILLEASPELNRLPQLWLTHLLDHMQRPGQSREDIVRRSAGLPAAFVALFTAEPTGHPKTLLYTGTAL